MEENGKESGRECEGKKVEENVGKKVEENVKERNVRKGWGIFSAKEEWRTKQKSELTAEEKICSSKNRNKIKMCIDWLEWGKDFRGHF